jgi:hypothetical protein
MILTCLITAIATTCIIVISNQESSKKKNENKFDNIYQNRGYYD